jgi:DNA-binding NtrC family response regulator
VTPPPPPGHDAADDAGPLWPQATVLVVDDEPGMRHFLQRSLGPRVAQVLVAGDADEAQALIGRHRVDLLILDIALPGRSGLDLLRALRTEGFTAEVVLITAFADLETAIEALRAGASDFLLKPFRITQVINAVQRGLERSRLQRENWLLRRALDRFVPASEGLVGRSLAMRGVQAALQRVAGVDSTVLLTGESGTGKELAARALHALGPQAAGPFVALNCAAVSPTLIEQELFGQGGPEGPHRDGLFVYAQGGTLFLDEIGELPLAQQATLLRVLEDRRVRPVGSAREIPVDVRIVAATNRPLAEDAEAGRFRKDLYYRLQVVEIRLPPLRSHLEDIPELVAHFNAVLSQRLGVPPIEVTDDELAYLAQYDWPGNVRELRNLMERSLIVGALNVSALYQGLQRREAERQAQRQQAAGTLAALGDGPTDLQTLEKQHILAVLDSVQGDKTRAAQLLGISRRTLERRTAEWGRG